MAPAPRSGGRLRLATLKPSPGASYTGRPADASSGVVCLSPRRGVVSSHALQGNTGAVSSHPNRGVPHDRDTTEPPWAPQWRSLLSVSQRRESEVVGCETPSTVPRLHMLSPWLSGSRQPWRGRYVPLPFWADRSRSHGAHGDGSCDRYPMQGGW
jgi:hypothetical protein